MPTPYLNTFSTLPGIRIELTESANANGVRQPDLRSTSTFTSVTESLTRQSMNTPGYTLLAQSGQLPYNTFSFAKRTQIHYNGVVQEYTKDGKGYTRTTYTGVLGLSPFSLNPYVFPSVLSANLENRVKQKALLAIKDMNVNLAQVWAEREMTARTIATAAARIGKAYSALKHGNFRGAAAALGLVNPGTSGFGRRYARNQSKAVARGWLELQYGWRPLLSDIYGAALELERSLAGGRKRYVSVTKSSSLEQTTKTASIPRDGTTDNIEVNAKLTKKAMVKMEMSSASLVRLSSLGLTNPAVIAWELTPFSFVVDWALPIGQWLSSIDAGLGWQFRSAAITTFLSSEITATRTATKRAGYDAYSAQGRESVVVYECNRSALVGFYDLMTLPTFKDPSSLEHALNALALLATHKR